MKTLIEGAMLAILVDHRVPARLARDADRRDRAAAVDHPDLLGHGRAWASRSISSACWRITIVTGILVDDAIVEIENIVRHMRMGKSPYRAALEAADEIGLAVIAITFTIIAVFTPVSFMGGIAGQYFKQFGLVVAAAVFFSLLVARLVTPMLAAYFMRDTEPRGEGRPAAARSTRGWSTGRCITASRRWRSGLVDLRRLDRLVLPAAVGLPAARGLRPHAARPSSCRPARASTTRARVTAKVAELHPPAPRGARRVFVNGGTLLGSGAEVRKATLIINLVPKDERKLTQADIKEAIGRDLADIPDIRFWFLQDNGQRQFALVVAGRDGARRQQGRGRADQPGQARLATRTARRCSPTSSRRPSSTGPS